MRSQLFVLLILGSFIGVSRYIPVEARQPIIILDTVSTNEICEKDLGNGMKMISKNRNRFVPCWSSERRN
jgi:hypothetical protein